jgi:hypothetical protein
MKFKKIEDFAKMSSEDARKIKGGLLAGEETTLDPAEESGGNTCLVAYDSAVTTYTDSYPGPQRDSSGADHYSDYKSAKD